VDVLEFGGTASGEKLLVTLDNDGADIEVGDSTDGTAVRISKEDAIALAQAILRTYHTAA
jgi:hypothetical protein